MMLATTQQQQSLPQVCCVLEVLGTSSVLPHSWHLHCQVILGSQVLLPR